ncbi:MAG: hypothetical protein WEC58_01260 [Candidatus Paceibacterota bacterium]
MLILNPSGVKNCGVVFEVLILFFARSSYLDHVVDVARRRHYKLFETTH